MWITSIEPVGKTGSRICFDGEEPIILYNKEISRYHIRPEQELSEEIYREIVESILMKRAKLRAMSLLKSMDRTEMQLRQKLDEGGFPRKVVEGAVEYVRSYHYIDDERYAASYIDYRRDGRSRKQITMELRRKGIPQDMIQRAWENSDEQEDDRGCGELTTIRNLLDKKHYDPNNTTPEQQQKLYMFLLRKGFRSSDISTCLRMRDLYESV